MSFQPIEGQHGEGCHLFQPEIREGLQHGLVVEVAGLAFVLALETLVEVGFGQHQALDLVEGHHDVVL